MGAGVLVVATLVGWWACTVDRAPPRAGRSVGDRLGRDRRLLARAVARHARRLLGPGVAFALFRFFDAAKPGPVAWADQLLQAAPRPAHRLGPGLRHPVRRLRRRAVHLAGDRAVEVRLSDRRHRGAGRAPRRGAAPGRRPGRDRRVLHRRPDRRRLHLARRLERLVRARLRHLFERGQDRDARRAGGADRGAWRGQRRGGVRHGRRRAGALARRASRSRSPASPGRAAARPPSRSARSGSASRRAARKPSPTLLQASGDRAAIRQASVARALELLIERCAAG